MLITCQEEIVKYYGKDEENALRKQQRFFEGIGRVQRKM
jgi:hypothetical protein